MNPCDVHNDTTLSKGRCRCRYWRHIHHRKRISQIKTRIVCKTGEFNIVKQNKSKYHGLPDLVTILTEARWRWTLIYCILAYLANWVFFATVWWSILYVHGDFELKHLPNESNSTEWKPCVREIYNFTSVFLFSIEIDTTIGYGKRTITIECKAAILTMCIESITGKIIQSLIIGIVFAKLTRPKHRAQTIIFSKNIIVNQRNKNLCLIFRVGNVRKSRIIGASVAAYLIKYETLDGDVLINDQAKLQLEIDSSGVLFAFPITVLHVIRENSPFYDMLACELLKSSLEILVVFEGIIESTGQIVQAKSSYTNDEMLWGRRFDNPVFYDKRKQGFIIDYGKFDVTQRINTPLCTARELQKYYEKVRKQCKTQNNCASNVGTSN